jgi:hypothetical protein
VNSWDPSGKYTIGFCGGLEAGIASLVGPSATGSLCLVRTQFTPQGNDDIGISETAGFGVVGVGAAAGAEAYLQISNANHLQDLSHWFYNSSVSIPTPIPFLGANGILLWGKDKSNQSIYGVDIGLSLGVGGGGFLISTNTWVQQAHQWELADTLRGIWDSGIPGGLSISIVSNLLRNVIRPLIQIKKTSLMVAINLCC